MKTLKRLLLLVVIGIIILSSVGSVHAQEGDPDGRQSTALHPHQSRAWRVASPD